MARKKTVWGKPGQTGVTDDGIPWRVPDTGPSFGSKLLYTLFPGGGNYIPAGAKFVPAETAAEVQERAMRKYGNEILRLLDDGEELRGFSQFLLDEKVPQPPRGGIEAKIGPNPVKRWWMGGDWNTLAGQLNIAIGGSRYHDPDGSGVHPRRELLIRTSRRVMIWDGSMETPVCLAGQYALDQIGLRPGWRPDDPANGDDARVDIAFADGSWLGVIGTNDAKIPGGATTRAQRDLLASLVGPPVTASVLPALGRG